MVSIPDRARMNAPRTPQPNGRLAQTGDLGLGAVADALGRTGRGLQNDADRRATEAFDDTQAQFDAVYLPEAQAYDGRAGGFARTQTARYDGFLDATAEGLDPDARRSFDRMRPQRRTAQVEAAIRVESQRSGERVARERDLSARLDAQDRMAVFNISYSARAKAAFDGWDGHTPGITNEIMAILDEDQAAAIATAPPETREHMMLLLGAQRGDEWLRLQSLEEAARETHVANRTLRIAGNLVTGVMASPESYDAADRSALQLGEGLPVRLGEKLVADTRRDLAVARFGGLLAGGNWQTVLTELDSGAWDEKLGEAKVEVLAAAQQARARAEAEAASVQRELAVDAIEDQVSAELVSLERTGVSTGLTIEQVTETAGPLAGQRYARQVALSREVYATTRGLLALPPDEQLARVESLRPAPGAADYDDKLAAFERAAASLTEIRTRQAVDPAQAIQAAPEAAANWRRFITTPNRETAALWAIDAFRRQAAMGVPQSGMRVLPAEFGQRIAARVKNAEGTDTLPALQEAAELVSAFGTSEGRILTELTRHGLDPRDAAMIGMAGENPVALAAYARARARGNVGLTAPVRRSVREAVVSRLGPLLETWAPRPGGLAGSDAFVSGVQTVADALAADGRSPAEAAREATQTYLNAYRFEDGWRIPRGLGEGDRPMMRSYPLGDTVNRPATIVIRHGARRTIEDLAAAGDLEPTGGPHLTEAQRRQRAIDTVLHAGRWVTSMDDSGLTLVIPDAERPNGVVEVRDRQGRMIQRSFDQLFERARRPDGVPRQADGRPVLERR